MIAFLEAKIWIVEVSEISDQKIKTHVYIYIYIYIGIYVYIGDSQ